jgi:integrase
MPKVNVFPITERYFRLRLRVAGKDYYRYITGSRGEAEAAARAWGGKAEYQGAPRVSASIKFRDWHALLLTMLPNLRPQSLRSYRALAKNHLGWLGDRSLASLTPADGIAYLAQLRNDGVGVATIHFAFRMVRSALTAATNMGVIANNPFAGVTMPKQPRTTKPVPTLEQLAALARDDGAEPARLGVLLAVATGARRGELMAIRWQDIDLDAGRLSINGQIECATTPVVRAPLKTEASRRTIALPASILPELRNARMDAARVALEIGVPIGDLPVLPARRDGSAWWHPDCFHKVAVAYLRSRGVPGSVGKLRHAHATSLISNRLNPVMVQKRLGHADITTTLKMYTHALPTDDEAAADFMSAFLAPKPAAVVQPIRPAAAD